MRVKLLAVFLKCLLSVHRKRCEGAVLLFYVFFDTQYSIFPTDPFQLGIFQKYSL